MSFLAPASSGRGRSKSPGARDRDSSRTREVDSSRKSRSAYDDDDSNTRRPSAVQYEDRAPAKRYDDDSSDDDRSRKSRSSRRPDDDPYEPVPRSSRYAPPADDDDRRPTGRRERDLYGQPDDDRDKYRPSANGASTGSRGEKYVDVAPSSSRYAPAPTSSSRDLDRPDMKQRHSSYAEPANPRSSQQLQYADYHDRQPSISKQYNTIEATPTSLAASRDHGRQPSYSGESGRNGAAPSRPSNSRHSTRDDSDDEKFPRRNAEYHVDSRRVSTIRDRSPNPGEAWRMEPPRGSIARAVSPRPGQDRDRSPPRRNAFMEVSRGSAARGVSPRPGGTSESDLRKSVSRLSVGGLGATLGVAGAAVAHHGGGKPPASPLQEAYHGTYQTISPLPSPLALAARGRDDDISDEDLDGSDDETSRQIRALQRERQAHTAPGKHAIVDVAPQSRSGGKLDPKQGVRHQRALSDASSVAISSHSRKSVKFYDPEDDAKRISDALKGTHKAANFKPLVEILPWLSIDDMSALKLEYKNVAKINGQGINLSKHIKARIPGNLGKALYAMSLGQYESDAYWANCFYQTGNSRRELLIESLIGRSNQQIREIKDQFKDKRYDDDLEKCMKSELRADKFRTAILLALEERRMPEGLQLDMRLVRNDAEDLYDALNGSRGVSETAMIEIVIVRSDAHLKEVMRYYERQFKANFAKEVLSKSKNLVGETLVHMLNGALNKPMRDAILLHGAIAEFNPKHSRNEGKSTQGRAELLISRIVRLHWEPRHMEKVKDEFERRYGMSVTRALGDDVNPNMKTSEGHAWVGFVSDIVRSSDPRL